MVNFNRTHLGRQEMLRHACRLMLSAFFVLALGQGLMWSPVLQAQAEESNSLCQKSPAFVAAIEKKFGRECDLISWREVFEQTELLVELSSVDELGALMSDVGETSISDLGITFLNSAVLRKGALNGRHNNKLLSLNLTFLNGAELQEESIVNFENVTNMRLMFNSKLLLKKVFMLNFSRLWFVTIGNNSFADAEMEIQPFAFTGLKRLRLLSFSKEIRLVNMKRAAFAGVPEMSSLPVDFDLDSPEVQSWD